MGVFVLAPHSTSQGMRLGLSLSYDILKTLGGEIKVETKEGEGSDSIASNFNYPINPNNLINCGCPKGWQDSDYATFRILIRDLKRAIFKCLPGI